MTSLNIMINYVDADIAYGESGAGYITMDLVNDYLIWTEGSAIVIDLMTSEPTTEELNEASTKIDPDAIVTVPLCLLMDYSHNVGGSYYTHKVLGMGENKRYVFGFSFDGATATEPQLEIWDDDNHNSTDKHVLGAGTPANSMIKGVCTTDSLPGEDWTGTALAGSDTARVLKLNNGNGALDALASGETSQELYANIKIVIPQNYATPGVEPFTSTIRFAWN